MNGALVGRTVLVPGVFSFAQLSRQSRCLPLHVPTGSGGDVPRFLYSRIISRIVLFPPVNAWKTTVNENTSRPRHRCRPFRPARTGDSLEKPRNASGWLFKCQPQLLQAASAAPHISRTNPGITAGFEYPADPRNGAELACVEPAHSSGLMCGPATRRHPLRHGLSLFLCFRGKDDKGTRSSCALCVLRGSIAQLTARTPVAAGDLQQLVLRPLSKS